MLELTNQTQITLPLFNELSQAHCPLEEFLITFVKCDFPMSPWADVKAWSWTIKSWI